MGQVNINIRVDENLKKDFSKLCENLGLTMTMAFTSFMKISLQENDIPFKLERKKTLSSILENFDSCSKEESEEISKRLASLTEEDKEVTKIEMIEF